MNSILRKWSFIEAISKSDSLESVFLYPSLQFTTPQLYIPGFGVSNLAIISLSSQVQKPYHNLMHKEKFLTLVRNSFRYWKGLSAKMYFHIRKVFSFDMMYCLCFNIWLNECYVSTLEEYWLFGVANFMCKKWTFYNLQEAMN